jgi:hypothetical protein
MADDTNLGQVASDAMSEALTSAASVSPPAEQEKPDIKVPSDLTKVSDGRARELVAAGAVDDADLPGKMYRRKSDRFVARIPNYTFNAYSDVLKDEWEEIKLTTEA